MDAITKLKKKRHGVAVKNGIKRANKHKKIIKQATFALRKQKKCEIVKSLFALPKQKRK
jgi:hypothetical protein